MCLAKQYCLNLNYRLIWLIMQYLQNESLFNIDDYYNEHFFLLIRLEYIPDLKK